VVAGTEGAEPDILPSWIVRAGQRRMLSRAMSGTFGWRGAVLLLAGVIALSIVPVHARYRNRAWAPNLAEVLPVECSVPMDRPSGELTGIGVHLLEGRRTFS
jgi:hypothetical protein